MILEGYKKTKEGLVAYSPIVRLEAWAFSLVIAAVIISGLFIFRDWLWASFGVYGGVYVPTPPFTKTVHLYSAFAFVILGILHLIIHVKNKEKPLLPVRTFSDFGHFLHSGMWLIWMSRKEVRGDEGLYNGRQRITYMAFLYISGLAAITGFLYLFHVLNHDLLFVHVLPGGLMFMVALFHVLIVIRKHDLVALKSVYFTGILPIKYIRKKKPLLYKQIKESTGSSLK